ncbi:protein trichome berefringence-like 7 isoform X2 [Manihot esculenta]|uniref:protein trichome berefringence-like 7 isoform X2 n=1 Tax=Manihot esculenta TaxID=3983 RepID=UPI000B5D630B|nr:protein trichome berefringence-like 7 isoform X2 [Manihot esculenta]
MPTFNRSKSFNQKALGVGSPRFLSFGSPRINRPSTVPHWFRLLVVIGSLLSFFIAIGGGFIYGLPSFSQAFQGYGIFKSNDSIGDCNVFDGNWVVDDSYPLYNASECPFVEQGFNCLGNGRKDEDYLKWRWKSKKCDIPRFNVYDILIMFQNKRVVFVGDSMSRSQWESLICLLMTGVEDKKSVYEVNSNKITKRIRFLGVRFHSFNFTIEFFRSVFLVQHVWMPIHAPKRVRSTLRLDKMDDISSKWVNSDVLIFNTGQWWVPGKLFETGCYFQVGNALKLGMSIPAAFKIALNTWALWVQNTVDTNRTRVFFRTFEPSHWRQPLSETRGKERRLFLDATWEIVKNMTVPVTILNITSMSAFRSDAHVGKWNDNSPIADCSHWCLPGVPDMWNEILLSFLLYQL